MTEVPASLEAPAVAGAVVSSEPESPKLILMLGAGASHEFMVPTMNDLTKEFCERYATHSSSIKRMRKKLTRAGFPTNIETVLSYATGQMRPRDAIKRSSPYVSHFVRSTGLQTDSGSKKLIRDIQDFISTTCTVTENYRVKQIGQHFRDFWAHLMSEFKLPDCGRIGHPCPDIDVFTTNYDNVVEQYGFQEGNEVFSGYTEAADDTATFAPAYYDKHRPVRLYKLHGSVTLGVLDDTKVFYSRQGLRIGDRHTSGAKIVDRVMIYGYEKIPSQDPYFELLHRLKTKLAQAQYAIVIGYSFSDLHILTILKEGLISNDRLKLSILDSHASSIKSRKFKASSKVKAFDGEFKEFSKLRAW